MAQTSLDNFKFQDNRLRNHLKMLKKCGSYIRITYASSKGAKKLVFNGVVERIGMKRVEVDNSCTVRYIPIIHIIDMEVLQ